MTRLDETTIDQHAERIREEYDEFSTFKRRRKAEMLAELEVRLEADVQAELVKLSQSVRTAYGMGVPKQVLRKATRAYTNTPYWNRIWDAAADDVQVPDRASKKAEEIKSFEIVTEDPKDKNAKYIEAGKKAELIVRTGPTGLLWEAPVHIPLERYALRGPWIAEPGLEWYVENDDGSRTLFEGYEQLLEWGDDQEQAIQRIEQEYDPRKVK